MAHKEIAFCRPKDYDVVVPGSPGTLLDIMRDYPLAWERAGNAQYFGGNGLLIGLAAERGTVYPDLGDKAMTAKWPALYLENDVASFGPVDIERAKKAQAALSGGPMLVERGGILDIAQRIRDGGFTGFNASTVTSQRAVGITADGQIADGVWESATLYEVAEDMLEQGCVAVMKLDGRGSTGIAEWRNGKAQLAWGWNTRKLPAVVAMRTVLRIWRPSELPKVDLDLNFDRNLTQNFKLREFACKGDKHTCGGCGAVSISPGFAELVARLQALRTKVGKPVNVTSGYRCAKHDAAVGSSSSPGRGPHTTGTAADIWWDGASVDQMAETAKSVGFTGIGRYYKQGFIHVDLRQPPSDFVG